MSDKVNDSKVINPSLPAFCLLVVSRRCNSKCRICSMWKNVPTGNELSVAEMKGFIKQLKLLVPEPIFVHLIGGEPLLFNGLFDVIKFINQNGFKTSITTNGYLINEEMAKSLVDSGLSGVFISLDSLNEQTHDFLRGIKGAYRMARQAIDYLAKYRTNSPERLSIGVTLTIMQKNIDEILPFTEWANANPIIDNIFFNAIIQPFEDTCDRNWIANDKYNFLWPQDLKHIHGILDKLIEFKNRGYKICNPVPQLKIVKAYFENPFTFLKNLGLKCPRGNTALEVNSTGDISICFYMPYLGNVRTDNIAELWHSEKMIKAMQEVDSCRKDCDLVVNCFYKLESINAKSN